MPDLAKSKTKSAVTNGTSMLPGADGRSAWARRARDVLAELVADLGGDPSEAERALCRRAAILVAELERREVAMAQADEVKAEDLDLFLRGVGVLARTLKTIGLKRAVKPPENLTAYLARIKAEAVAAEGVS